MKTQTQLWDLWSYDVVGNAEDGFDVNDRNCLCRSIEITVKEQIYNVGTAQQFSDYIPTDEQIYEIIQHWFNFTNIELENLEFDGDGEYVHVDLTENGYPLCELNRV